MEAFTQSIQGNPELQKTLYFARGKVDEMTNTAFLAAVADYVQHDTFASQTYGNCAPDTGAANTKTWKTLESRDIRNTFMPIKLSPDSGIYLTGALYYIAKDKDFCNAVDAIPDTLCKITDDGEPKLDQDLSYSTLLEEFQGDDESMQVSIKLLRKVAKFGALQKIQEVSQTASNLSISLLRTLLFIDMKADEVVNFAPQLESFIVTWKAADVKKPTERTTGGGGRKAPINPNTFEMLSVTAARTQAPVTKRQPNTK